MHDWSYWIEGKFKWIVVSLDKKTKFPITDFFSKCDQIRRKLWTWSHSLKKSLMKNFVFVQCLLQVTGRNTRNGMKKIANPDKEFISWVKFLKLKKIFRNYKAIYIKNLQRRFFIYHHNAECGYYILFIIFWVLSLWLK